MIASDDAAFKPSSHSLTVGRRRLHYVDWGNLAAPTLLMVHGGRDHCRSWDWMAQHLRQDWHIVAPDLAGHGDSDWHNSGLYDMASFVPDLAALVDSLGPEPVSIFAHSLGGMISLRYAGLYPDRVKRICAIEGMGMSPRSLAKEAAIPVEQRFADFIANRQQVAARKQRLYPTIEAATERMKSENPFLTDEQAAHLTRHGVRQVDGGEFGWKFDPYLRLMPLADMPQAEINRLWTLITCPLLMIYGSKSWASNPLEDGRAAFLQQARVVTIEGAQHWVHHDHPDEVLDLVSPFLRGEAG